MTQNWLVAIDDSDIALKPIAWILANREHWRETPTIHLLNVQANLPRDIGRFINADTIREFHSDNGMAALAPARDQLIAAGITPEVHLLVGEAAPTISEFAISHQCAQILIGTRGHSGLSGTLLGSVANKLASLSTVPPLLVR